MSRQAYTLVELMVVLAIIAITAVLAMPRVNEWVARQQAKRVIAQLITDYSKAVSLSSKTTTTVGTSGSLTNRAAIMFRNANNEHSYTLLWRNNGNNSGWTIADVPVKTVKLPSGVYFTNVNETSLGSSGSAVISFTSTGIALDGANTMVNNKSFYDTPSSCGGDTTTKRYSARIDLRTDITGTKAIYYRVELNQFGEYRVCASVGDANFASNGLELKGI